MYKILLAAGAAALAMTPALAGHGNGGGGGEGHGGGGGGDMRAMGGGGHGDGGGKHGGGEFRAMNGGHGHGGEFKAERHAFKNERHAFKEERHADRKFDRQPRDFRSAERTFERDRNFDGRRDDNRYANNGFANGCPPGLAAKNNGCLPPGQARKLVGLALPGEYARSMLSGPYAAWYPDDDRYLYRQTGDSIYRVDRGTNLVDALIPYGGSDFNYYPVGMNYPADYNYYNVPNQYRSYYPDGGDYAYRYGDNAIYSVNPQNSAIQSIVALLAGDLGVGQRLPSNYGVYNVPLSYRDRYADNADNMYRYNDGYIYRADPRTQLITSVINTLI